MTRLVEIRDLNIRFSGERTVHAVNDLSLSLGEGEVLGLLGESGSGKSVTLRALMRLLPKKRTQISGRVEVLGRDVLALDDEELSAFRGQTVSMIFQEPALALDPVYTIGHQIAESVMRHEGKSHSEAMARALEMLEVVRIPSAKRRLDAYPHEMSGGMRQRAMIALALACKPKILLADEPTTALDATVQIQILLLLRELQREFGMSVIFVTHDIGVAIEICDRVAQPDRAFTRPSLCARPVGFDRAWRQTGPAAGNDSGNASLARQGAEQLFFCAALRFCGSPLPRTVAAQRADRAGPDCKMHPGGARGGHCREIVRAVRRRFRKAANPAAVLEIPQIGVVTSGDCR
jgi:ABC-type dipeptide/oligopeptide/nickel transport system ATPase subunit